ncbi:hypothetical protein EDEG_03932 [Edhazardia aedis USNM 41457]|uniref:Uncharacterized protein n=1 Tax=Edhazardia aedis (strain USNM 41457) TaxID=1003232 RepID=J9D1N0_EDHAE|nr:hypothetical protein EDEG_03932 [Edhazardia aedis USNM 41457]|eukprot:EJW01484.1 hypothetical protein EDEG_03932 [Edhazardia aedis USNM 41457]
MQNFWDVCSLYNLICYMHTIKFVNLFFFIPKKDNEILCLKMTTSYKIFIFTHVDSKIFSILDFCYLYSVIDVDRFLVLFYIIYQMLRTTKSIRRKKNHHNFLFCLYTYF